MINGYIRFNALSMNSIGIGNVIGVRVDLVDIICENSNIHERICKDLKNKGIQHFYNAGMFAMDERETFDDCGNITDIIEFARDNSMCVDLRLDELMWNYLYDIDKSEKEIEDILYYEEFSTEQIDYIKEHCRVDSIKEALNKIGCSVITEIADLCKEYNVDYYIDDSTLKTMNKSSIVHLNIYNI